MSSDSSKKQQRHRRKESFSILLVSNLGSDSRQFHISRFTVRLLIFLFIAILAAIGVMIFIFSHNFKNQNSLHRQIDEQAKTIKELEGENEKLTQEKQGLTAEIETLNQTLEENAAKEAQAAKEQEAPPVPDTALPSRYPCLGSGIMTTMFAQDHPYVTINAQADGKIVAAGDGTVRTVGSDDTYAVIIEIDHGNGYHTRYMCLANQEVKVTEGAQIKSGDELFTIQSGDTQLDYQVTLNGESIDPLTIIEAKG